MYEQQLLLFRCSGGVDNPADIDDPILLNLDSLTEKPLNPIPGVSDITIDPVPIVASPFPRRPTLPTAPTVIDDKVVAHLIRMHANHNDLAGSWRALRWLLRQKRKLDTAVAPEYVPFYAFSLIYCKHIYIFGISSHFNFYILDSCATER